MKTLIDVQQDYLTHAVLWIVPEVVLVGAACVLFLAALVVPRRITAVVLGLTGIVGAGVGAVWLGGHEVASYWAIVEGTQFSPQAVAPFDPTGVAAFVRWLALGAAAVFVLLGWAETRDDNACEYVACVMVAAAGTSLVGRANDLISLFLALELLSIPTYVLLYLPIRSRVGQEAAAKYFLLSVLSSALLLFGFSYLYGLTGTTNLGAVVEVLAAAGSPGLLGLVAMVMVIAGLGFRLAAFPFHFYAPDVYEAGPTGVVTQLAVLPKVAGLVALARVLGLASPQLGAALPFDATHTLIPLTLWVLAAVTMTFGNVLALLQDNLKRMLAYSGIAHGGYMLIGLVAASSVPDAGGAEPAQSGLDAVLFYLVAYGLMTAGVFAVLMHLAAAEPGRPAETVDDLAGLGRTHPVSAGLLFVFFLSLIGIPLTVGFVGKLLLFVSAFTAPDTPPMGGMYRALAVIAAVNAAVAAVYYLRVLGVMYLRTPLTPIPTARWTPALAAAAVCALATLGLGVYPKPLATAAKTAAPVANSIPAIAAH